MATNNMQFQSTLQTWWFQEFVSPALQPTQTVTALSISAARPAPHANVSAGIKTPVVHAKAGSLPLSAPVAAAVAAVAVAAAVSVSSMSLLISELAFSNVHTAI
jgi:hypothetical protein